MLTTTDMHGKFWDVNLLSGAPERSNLLRVSTAAALHRREYSPSNVLLLDNGDLTGASPIAELGISEYTGSESDTLPAMAVLLSEIGYDALIPGNHEFCYPWKNMSAVLLIQLLILQFHFSVFVYVMPGQQFH